MKLQNKTFQYSQIQHEEQHHELKFLKIMHQLSGELGVLIDADTFQIKYISPALSAKLKIVSADCIGKTIDNFLDSVSFQLLKEKLSANSEDREGLFFTKWQAGRRRARLFICKIKLGNSESLVYLQLFSVRRGEKSNVFKDNIFESAINALTDIIGIQDLQNRVLAYNETGYKFLQKKPEQVIGKKCYELIGRNEPCDMCATRTAIRSGQPARIIKFFEEIGRWFDARSYPLFDENGKMIAIIEHLRDISQEENIKNALRESEARYRELVELSNDAVFLVENGKLKMVNQKFAEMSGYSREEILSPDFNWKKLIAPESLNIFVDRDWRVGHKKPVDTLYEFTVRRKNGKKIYCEVHMALLQKEGKKIVQGIVRDISQRKQMEEELKQSEERFRLLFQSMQEGFLFFSLTGKITHVNPAFCQMIGYKESELMGITIPRLAKMLNVNSIEVMKRFKEFIFQQKFTPIWEIRNRSGETLTISLKPNLVKKGGKPIGVSVIIRDISEQKIAENKLIENEQFLNSVFEGIQDGLSILDSDLNILRVNRWMRKRYYHVQDFVGKKCYDVFHGKSEPCSPCPSILSLKTGEKQVQEVPYRVAGEQIGWMELSTYPLFDKDGKIVGVIESVKDVTQRKNDARQLEKSLREKEVLLKEIHHRVKNNLQVISGLLLMQAKEFSSEYIKNAFEKSRQRIFSMALVHDKLYRSEDFSAIQLDKYIETMAKNIIIANNLNQQIELKFDLININLPLDKAVPFGLILNEILMNATKYAFPDKEKGEIQITMKKKKKNIQIEIKDNGIGMPADVLAEKEDTLGMHLIDILVDQLDGKIDIKTKNGTTIQLEFCAE